MFNRYNSNSSENIFALPILKVLIVVFSMGAALGTGIGYGFVRATCQVESKSKALVTLAEYERINPQMALTEVESILGRGTEIHSSESTAIFIWTNPDDSFIRVKFEQDKLTEKEQTGL